MNLVSAATLAGTILVALSAGAQAPAPKPIQAASDPAAAPPATATRSTAKRASGKQPSTADARVCLEFPNEMQVIKCSEKYRWQQTAGD
jgi:hypothetical protein